MRQSLVLSLFFALFLSSCATYYQVNTAFNSQFEQGNLEAAEKQLKATKTKKTKFLYLANRGVVNTLTGNYEASNQLLEKAYIYQQDYQKNYLDEGASFLVNPTLTAYKPEDHEQLLLLYYKALNYLKINNYSAALVECRRLNEQLQVLSDKYKSDNKYKRDAFIHNLMGIIYEASGDVNNAFIAYRNASEIYEEDYERLFGLGTPEQLKQDLLRTAAQMGFDEEVDFYERKWDLKYTPEKKGQAELIFFWHNGLGPVKGEWSINFAVEKGSDGFVTFANSEQGMSFPFPISTANGSQQGGGLGDLSVLRIAFPKYEERKTVFQSASLTGPLGTYELQKAEDVNQIAFKTLQERMVREFGKGLLRAAMKKAAEEQVRKESEGWGAVIGLVNAMTEKADTRNWQTIPHSIYYTRMPIQAGENEVVLTTTGSFSTSHSFKITAQSGETTFQFFQSLEAQPVR